MKVMNINLKRSLVVMVVFLFALFSVVVGGQKAWADPTQLELEVPTSMPLALQADGSVVSPTNWEINNKTDKDVEVTQINLSAVRNNTPSFTITAKQGSAQQFSATLTNSSKTQNVAYSKTVSGGGTLPLLWDVSFVKSNETNQLFSDATKGSVAFLSLNVVYTMDINGTLTIAGTPKVGETLTSTLKDFPTDGTAAYQWYRDDTAITGQTGTTYTTTDDDVDKYITCKVTDSTGKYTGTLTSNKIGPIESDKLAGTLTIAGNKTVGETLTSTLSGFTKGATAAYQWYRGTTAITNATGTTYTTTDDDLGYNITCKVTDSSGNYTGTITSNAIGPVEKEFAFATYSSADNSFNMYKRTLTKIPAVGDTFSNKTATNVYLNLENSGGSLDTWEQPWHAIASNVKVAEVVDDGIKPATMHTWFLDFSNMTEIKNFTKLDTSANVWSRGTFQGCSSLTSIDLSKYDTSQNEDMGAMFQDCSSLTSVDVSGFNTSNVVNMGRMFYNCSSLKSVVGLTSFDTSKVGNLNSNGVDKRNGLNGMFQFCSAIEALDFSSFITTSNHKTIRSETLWSPGLIFMFSECPSLKTLILPKNFGVLVDGSTDEGSRPEFPVKMYDEAYNTTYEAGTVIPIITMEPCPRTFVAVN